MTHWKRIILYPWTVCTLFLIATWFSTLYYSSFITIGLSTSRTNLSISRGTAFVRSTDDVTPFGGTPVNDINVDFGKEDWDYISGEHMSWFGRFHFSKHSLLPGSNHIEIMIPVWFLILLHTI